MIQKILREPLVHFLILGALLFVIADIRSGGVEGDSRVIDITSERVEQLALAFEEDWQRPPTVEELREVIDDFVQDEIYYREARMLGLDEDDSVVRRRLREKMEFLTDEGDDTVPTDAQLQAYLETHVEEFRLLPRYRLKQIFLSVDRRGAEGAEAEARRLLEGLPAGEWPDGGESLGDRTLVTMPEGWTDAVEIGRLFGAVFARKVDDLPEGSWSSPLRSGYGLHLLLVTAREPGRRPDLEEVRASVQRDFLAARRQELAAAHYRELASRYEVRMDPLELDLDGDQAVGESAAGAERSP